MPTAPKLSPQTTEHLQNARVLARATADALEHEATKVKNLQNMPSDILYVREFPEHFQRGVERGGRRLAYAAQAVRRISDDVDKILSGAGVPTAFGREADLEVPTSRRHGKRTVIDPAQTRHHISPIRGHVDLSEEMRRNLRRIETELSGAATQKGIAAMIETIDVARGSLQNFEQFINALVSRVRKVVAAIEDWDRNGQKGKRPPLPAAKPRKPGKGRKPGTTGKPTGVGNTKWPGQNASKQDVACYLAAQARKYGLPPTLPVTAALVESGLGNVGHGDRDSVGLFQIRANMHPAPPGFGSASGKIQSANWWVQHPDAQMKWFAIEAKRVSHGSGTDAASIGTWAANTERPAAEYRGRYQQHFPEAKKYVDKCATLQQTLVPGKVHLPGGKIPPAKKPLPTKPSTTVKKPGGKNPEGKTYAQKALKFALAEAGKGISESQGPNKGPGIEKYMQSTHTSYGQAWCAAFVHWCLQQAGFKFPNLPAGASWAQVSAYQREANRDGGTMYKVSHQDARPGDLIAWGDGHIGMVVSAGDGKINIVAGNDSSKVNRRAVDMGGSFTIIRPRV